MRNHYSNTCRSTYKGYRGKIHPFPIAAMVTLYSTVKDCSWFVDLTVIVGQLHLLFLIHFPASRLLRI